MVVAQLRLNLADDLATLNAIASSQMPQLGIDLCFSGHSSQWIVYYFQANINALSGRRKELILEQKQNLVNFVRFGKIRPFFN